MGTMFFEKSKGQPFETLTHAQEIKRSQRNLNLMDRISDFSEIFRNQKGVKILVRWISHGRWPKPPKCIRINLLLPRRRFELRSKQPTAQDIFFT